MLTGTSVIKLEVFISNLKDIAGTCFLTRIEYDNNSQKVCSYAHVYKNFGLTWNSLLEQAGIPITRKYAFPIKQGRKPKDTSKSREIYCLRCLKLFISIDPKVNRICLKCKKLEDQED